MSLVYNFKLALQKSDFQFNRFKIAGKQIIQCDFTVLLKHIQTDTRVAVRFWILYVQRSFISR